jgi:hypothetical protein
VAISTFTIIFFVVVDGGLEHKRDTIVANGVEQLWVIYTKELSLGTWEHFLGLRENISSQ